jgi:hypothetical protein
MLRQLGGRDDDLCVADVVVGHENHLQQVACLGVVVYDLGH